MGIVMKRSILALVCWFVVIGTATADGTLADLVQAEKRDAALGLINSGVNVNVSQGDGTTPLHWAIYNVDAELAAVLLERGARPDVINNYGSSPLAEAVKVADARLVKMLLDAGADVEAPNQEGQTVLMLAARAGSMDVADGTGLKLYCGDYFAVSAAQLEHIRLVYDRAALVALPEPMRQRYVTHMRESLPAGWRMLLLTFDYPQEQRPGPPFSVTDAEVRRLFQGCAIDLLAEQQVIDRHPGFREQGLTSMIERVYRISDSRH